LYFFRVIPFILIQFSLVVSLYSFDVDHDIDRALEDSLKQNKKVMIFFHKDNCRFCERMIFALEEDELKKIVNKNFIMIDINIDDDEKVKYLDFNGTNREFAKYMDIDFYPVTLFIDSDKKILHSAMGFFNIKLLLKHFDFILSGAYKKMSFEKFRKEGRKEKR